MAHRVFAQSYRSCLGIAALGVLAGSFGLLAAPPSGRWSVVVSTAAGLPQDVWLNAQGNNKTGWKGGGVICLGHLAQGFEVGQHVTLKPQVVEAGLVGEDGTPVQPGTYLAPSAELGDREFEVVDGETFYMIIENRVVNSNVPGFEVGDVLTIMFTFDALFGHQNQFVVLWFETPDGFVPALNEGVMMTNLRFR